jgi:hypothetical protein
MKVLLSLDKLLGVPDNFLGQDGNILKKVDGSLQQVQYGRACLLKVAKSIQHCQPLSPGPRAPDVLPAGEAPRNHVFDLLPKQGALMIALPGLHRFFQDPDLAVLEAQVQGS